MLAIRLVALSLVAAWALPAQADLTNAQKQTLAQAQHAYNQFVTNFNLAAQSAGSGTPKGSRARLAQMRLNSAKQHLPLVDGALKQLPKDDPQVLQLQQQYATALDSVAELETRLSGKPAPKPQPQPVDMGGDKPAPKPADPTPQPAEPAPTPTPSATKKLDYRQEDAFRKARFSLREVVGLASALKEFSGKVVDVEDVSTLDHRLMAQSINSIKLANKRMTEFNTHFQGLPRNGEGVAEAADQYATAKADIEKANEILAPRWEQLAKMIDPGSYPQLAEDYDRLRNLSGMFSNLQVMLTDRTAAAGLIEQMGPARKEADRILAAYAVMVRQKTDMGVKLMKQYDYFGTKLKGFEQAVEQQKGQLPQEIEGHLGQARKYAEQAVAEKKPLFFTGGIPQQLDFAREKMGLYKAIDASAAKSLQDQMDRFDGELKTMQESLREQIIAENPLPPDRYRGADRDDLVARATKTWKEKRDPNAKVLGARIPSENWKREVLWRSQNAGSWYKIDRSRIQVQLLVADKNENLAVIEPVNFYKDHLSNDQIKALLFHSKDEELLPQSYLLRAKIK